MKFNVTILLALLQACFLTIPSANADDHAYGTATLNRTDLSRTGEEKDVMRRDPSDIDLWMPPSKQIPTRNRGIFIKTTTY